MEEKKTLKIGFSTFFLILSILIIIVMAYFIYKINNEKNIETQKVANLNNEVNTLQSTVNNLNEKINDVSNIVNSPNNDNTISNNSINTNNSNIINNTSNNARSSKYIEMTENNYKKYNTLPYSYRIQEMIDNGNDTITIKGRVYTYDEKASANIEGEVGVYNGTDVYLEITLPEDLDCEWGKSITTVRGEYDARKSYGTLIVKDEDNITAPLSNDEFHFKNGKCTSIWFSNI